jgi:hypothetical protein
MYKIFDSHEKPCTSISKRILQLWSGVKNYFAFLKALLIFLAPMEYLDRNVQNWLSKSAQKSQVVIFGAWRILQ